MEHLMWFYYQHLNTLDMHLIKLLEHFFTLKRNHLIFIIYNQCDKTKFKNHFLSSLHSDTIIYD